MLQANKLKNAIRALTTGRMRVMSDAIPYDFERVPPRKVLNGFLVEASVVFKPSRPWGGPTHIMCEPSSLCNLNCALCPVTIGLKRPVGFMTPDLFQRTIDQVADTAFIGLLWDWGEPFLNPAIFDMIAYARSKGLRLVSSTNGHPFVNPAMAERLVKSGLDSIIFAIDGATQETYQLYRQGGSLGHALEGIRNVVREKRARGAGTPLINFRFIVMRQNEHEIPRVEELAESLGVDVLSFKTVNTGCRNPYSKDESRRQMDFLPADPRFRRFTLGIDGLPERRRRNPCRELWTGPSVHSSGKISPCTFDPNEDYVMGDLHQQSFREIWTGEKYQNLRRRFRRSWESIPVCSACTHSYVGGSCSTETIAQTRFFHQPSRKVT
jgi:radical SAM protein with 4Fe4S-binding SPASM domain